MSNKAATEKASDIVKIFHSTVKQISEKADYMKEDLTVDVEMRFKGIIISKKGSRLLFWKDKEVKESNIKLNIATSIHIPAKPET